MRNYIAYGSNLNIRQMLWRCPDAKVVGTAYLKGWELLFKGSRTGSYLTIERKAGSVVPIAIWSVSESDELALDRYEGCPAFYYKLENVKLDCYDLKGKKKRVTAFVYIMHEDRQIGIPSSMYMETCEEGYEAFGFDKVYLDDAYDKSVCYEGMRRCG